MVQRPKSKREDKPGYRAVARFSPEPAPLPVEQSRYDQLLMGDIKVSDLDKDELRLGKLRNAKGRFDPGNGRNLPEAIQAAMKREFHKRLFDEINKHGFDAVETIVDVMNRGEGASAYQGQKDGTKRLDAAKYLLERVIGTIPTKTENTSEVTVWQNLNEGGGLFVDVDAEEIHDDSQRAIEPEKALPVPRKRGPRTRPRKANLDAPEPPQG